MERIHTRVVIKIDTGEVLEDRFYLYNGPMAWCGEDPGEADEAGNYGMGPIGGAGNYGTYGADPSGLAGMFAGTDLGADFGSGFFGSGGGYDQNTQWGKDFIDEAIMAVRQGLPLPARTKHALGLLSPVVAAGAMVDMLRNAFENETVVSKKAHEQLDSMFGADVVNGALLGKTPGDASGTGAGGPSATSSNDAAPLTSGPGSSPVGGTGGNMATTGGPTSLAEMALDLYNKTGPARQSIIDRGTNFLEGGLDVTQSPLWGSGKNAAETQYQNARDAMMANLPGGGALQSSLATGETDKARTLTDLASRIGMDEYSKIYGLASGAPQQSMAGMGVAGQTNATLAGQEMYQNIQEDAQKNQLYGDLGAGIGEGWGDKE